MYIYYLNTPLTILTQVCIDMFPFLSFLLSLELFKNMFSLGLFGEEIQYLDGMCVVKKSENSNPEWLDDIIIEFDNVPSRDQC